MRTPSPLPMGSESDSSSAAFRIACPLRCVKGNASFGTNYVFTTINRNRLPWPRFKAHVYRGSNDECFHESVIIAICLLDVDSKVNHNRSN